MVRPHVFWILCLLFVCSCSSSEESGKGGESRPPEARFSMEIPEIFSDGSGSFRAPVRVFVDAAASSDPDGMLVRYAWEVNGAAAGEGRARWLDLVAAGSHEIRLTVTDGDGLIHSQVNTLLLGSPETLAISGRLYAVAAAVVPTASAENRIADVIPGEILVRFREKNQTSRSALGEDGWHSVEGDGERALFRMSGLRRAQAEDTEALVAETIEMASRLARRKDVLWAWPNQSRRLFSVPVNDRGYVEKPDRFWPLDLIRVPEAWQATRGAGAVVAVLDTGIVAAHPDLKDRLGADGYDFVDMDTNPEDPGTGSHMFHGTQVAGLALATADNATGMAGVACRASLMALRVIDGRGAVDTWSLVQAIRYAAGLANSSGLLPSRKADVINMSLGGEGENPAEKEAVADALAAGVLMTAAAGNDGRMRKNYPAAYPGVFAVGGVNRNLERAEYQDAYGKYGSNYGDWISLVAPWGPVYTTSGPSGSVGGAYVDAAGTSFSTPFVSGVLALMRTHDPALSPARVESLLQQGGMTRDIGLSGRDRDTGWGLVDAARALEVLSEFSLVMQPEELDLGLSGTAGFLYLGNGGGRIVQVESPMGPDWIRVTGEMVFPDGLGLYRVEVLRGHPGFPQGGGEGVLAIGTASGSVSYPVRVGGVPASPLPLQGDGYGIVLENVTDGKRIRIALDAGNRGADGGYVWAVSDVPAGLYRIRADGGAEGAYPSGRGAVVWLYPGAPDMDRLDFVAKIP